MGKYKILLTGFEPFGGETINPALLAVNEAKAPHGVQLFKISVPVVFGKAERCVLDAIEKYGPDAVIMVGQAGGRSSVTPERVAINLRDAAVPDNDGNILCDEPVCPGGKTAYFSTLPIKKIRDAVKAAGIACEISNTAGTFVCNSLFFGVLHALEHTAVKAGFIHVPYLPEQAEGKNVPSLCLADMVKALEIALEICVKGDNT